MRQEDMEKTQYLGIPEQGEAKSPPAKGNLEDTQSLPRLDAADEGIQPPFPQRERTVRELERLPGEPPAAREKVPSKGGGRAGKLLLLAAGFAAALLLGFFLAGMAADRSEQAASDHQAQVQALQARQQRLEAQEDELRRQRESLQEEKERLEKRRQEIAGEAGRLDGIGEQIREGQPTSALEKFVDKVSGKEKERRQAMEENRQKRAQAASDASSVEQSIREAQDMLDDVNTRLDTLVSMKQEADRMKAQAESAYEENKDIIDSILHYATEGAKLLRRMADAEK